MQDERIYIHSNSCGRSARSLCNVQLDPGLLLQIEDDPEQVTRLRIAARPEHADQTLRRRGRRLPQLFEADRRLNVALM